MSIREVNLPEGVLSRVALEDKNTLGFSAEARYFSQPENLEQLQDLLIFAREHSLPVFALGGGSNLILKSDLNALVIQMNNQTLSYQQGGDGCVIATVGAGVNWHRLVMDSVEQGYFGLENLALIPGNVGAAPVQNIGAYGVELSDRLIHLQAINIASGEVLNLTAEECCFAYRDSIFKQALKGQVIITELTLALSSTSDDVRLGYGDLSAHMENKVLTAQNIADSVCAIRQSKLPDPDVLGNAGSFFKNPIIASEQAGQLKQQYSNLPVYPVGDTYSKLAAGWLIDQCGFKGYRKGSVGVYDKQALVLVHYGQGHVSELLVLADEIKAAVKNKFSVELEIEPQLVS